ncbi:FkbM family methyltransferase [Reyranella massiliensis]|uniref:FkbM family methyltransferase n=1 Tax=Reyranella massiliensis TaxID=445220 RepID=UPI000312BCA6|nr:FkbM family methyltransferase [Reyranella massiliensis]
MDVQAILPFEARRALRMVLPQSLLNWREAKFYGRYGEVELHLLKFLCRRDADAIDVGANDGSYVHYLRRHAHKVVAFEPMPVLASALRKKFPGGEVVIEQVALSDRADTVELHMPVVDGIVVTGCSTISTDASGTYPATQAIKVSMDRLDTVYKGRAGFIKIDVEGHEQAVLDGALQTIRRCRPRVLVEIDDRLSPGGLARARTYFDSLGYTGHYVRKGKLEPISTFSVEEMQRPDRLPDLTAPLTERKRFGAYIYNFIFLPAEEPTSTVQRISAHLRTL